MPSDKSQRDPGASEPAVPTAFERAAPRPLVPGLMLEEPDWARVALQAAGPIRQSPGAGPVAWRLGPDDVTCFARGGDVLPAPFETAASMEGTNQAQGLRAWRLRRQVESLPAGVLAAAHDVASAASRGAALVTAWEDDGARTLLDLVGLSSVAIEGPPVAAGVALGDAIAELAGRRWSDLDELVLVGVGSGGVGSGVGAGGACAGLEHVRRLPDIEAAELLVREALAAPRPDGDTASRCLVVVPGFPGSGMSGVLSTLVSLVEQLPRTCLLCCDPAAPVRALWRFEASKAATLLEVRERGSVVATLRRRGRPAEGEEAPPHRPIEARPAARQALAAPLPAAAPEPLRIALLGPLSVTGAPADVARRPKASELLVYLALHPEGATGETLMAAIWSERRIPLQSLSNRLSEVRRALGRDPDGSPRLGRRAGRHVLGRDVWCDWSEFQRLTCPGTTVEAWMAALRLVRGRPLQGVEVGDWFALEGHSAAIERALMTTVMAASEALLEAGDPVGADWAARRGLIVAPWDERPYRQLMRAASLAGNPRGIHAALRALARALNLRGDPLKGVHPRTAELYRHLLG